MFNLPSPDRLRELVESVAWGLAAEAKEGDDLVALPHAAKLPTGTAYIHWAPAIVVTPGEKVTWKVVERGDEFAGTFTVSETGDIDGVYPLAKAPVLARRRELTREGNAARFTLVAELEAHVQGLLEATNRFVAREIEDRLGDSDEGWAPTSNHGVVDKVALEELATELLWGADGRDDSTVLRMVDRAATTPINNQPLGAWFDKNLRARCEEAVRRRIGDPHIGRKVRRLHREQSPGSIDELLELYKRAHPRESVGRDRVMAALSADKTIDSVAHSLDLVTNSTAAVLVGSSNEEATA